MLFKDLNAVYSKDHMKPHRVRKVRTAQLLTVKADDAYHFNTALEKIK
jgi:hypothetical protein